MRTNWDDHRYFLAIARERSLTAAGKALGVSQPTVSRRLEAMEAKLKVRLFDRTQQGYELTAIGMDLFDTIQRVEEDLAEADRKIYGKDQDLTGGLRIICTEILLNGYLSPFVWQFLSQNPGIELSVICTDSQLSLSRSDADLAIRFTQRPTETLAGRRLASVAYGVYTASGTAGDRFTSSNRAEWDWIGVHDEMHNRNFLGPCSPKAVSNTGSRVWRRCNRWCAVASVSPCCHVTPPTETRACAEPNQSHFWTTNLISGSCTIPTSGACIAFGSSPTS